jgi:serine/threonine-protein kinase
MPERYEGFEIVGQGAMGVVYKAHDRDLDRVVAIKTIHPNSAARGDDFDVVAARLCREAMAAARLTHPGIMAIYDVGRVAETPYIVMEYFKGRTLAEVLEAEPLPPARAVHVIVQVCRALEYAHAEGVVHRDIKTSNIMVDARWNAKLTDFGVARMLDKPVNETTMLVGTPAYMSPEQARGAPADARSDLFAVGVVLYEALTGMKAFPGEDVATVLDEVLHVEPVPARERNFAVSPALDAVVRRALDKDPADRYADAAAFSDALMQAAAIGGSGGGLLWASRGRRAALVVGAVVVSLVAGFLASPLFGPPHGDERTVAFVAEPRPVAPMPAIPATAPAPALPVAVAPAVPAQPAEPAAPAPRAGRAKSAASTAPTATVAPEPVATAPAAAAKPGCVSVNAVPFAKVYVDGRLVGDTPQACVRVRQGAHRIQFEWAAERSPEHAIMVTAEHTRDNPLRASYDFREGRFVAGSD